MIPPLQAKCSLADDSAVLLGSERAWRKTLSGSFAAKVDSGKDVSNMMQQIRERNMAAALHTQQPSGKHWRAHPAHSGKGVILPPQANDACVLFSAEQAKLLSQPPLDTTPAKRLQRQPPLLQFEGFNQDTRTTPIANRVATSLIAMLQGVDVLCNLAIMFLYKDDFHISPSTMAMVTSLTRVPWIFKPLFAIMSDVMPLFGYRRKSYVLIGASICCFSMLAIGTFGYMHVVPATILLFLFCIGSTLCNVIGEALVVEEGRQCRAEGTSGATYAVSTFFAFRKLSLAVMSYLSGLLLKYMPKQQVFTLAAFIPLLVLMSTLLVSEPPHTGPPGSFKRQAQRLKDTVSQPCLMNSTIFIFLLMATPSAGSSVFFFMTNDLKFGVELLGRMALFQSLASLVGIITYMTFFSSSSMKRLLLVSTLVVIPFCLLPVVVVQRWNRLAGIPDSFFIFTDNVLMEFVGEFQILPILILAAELCPSGLESTIYSFFLSVFNLGFLFGALLSSALTAAFGVTATSFTNLSALIVVCALSNYIPLAFLHLVPSRSEVEKQSKQAAASCHYPVNEFDELLSLRNSCSESDLESTSASSRSQSNDTDRAE